jgi:hypothetical protein
MWWDKGWGRGWGRLHRACRDLGEAESRQKMTAAEMQCAGQGLLKGAGGGLSKCNQCGFATRSAMQL